MGSLFELIAAEILRPIFLAAIAAPLALVNYCLGNPANFIIPAMAISGVLYSLTLGIMQVLDFFFHDDSKPPEDQ